MRESHTFLNFFRSTFKAPLKALETALHPQKTSKLPLFFLYIRQVSAGLIIYQPVFVPFLLERGLNMLDVALLQTTYNLGVLALDIPTGFFADKVGRKWALACANAALVIGTCLLVFGHSLFVFILAELFYALAIAMDSGTHSAYLYEWLRTHKKENEYYRYDALGTFLLLGIGSLGTLVAGYAAEGSLLIPVTLTVVLTAIGVPAACLLPNIEKDGFFSKTSLQDNLERSEISIKGALRILQRIFNTNGLIWAIGLTALWFWARQFNNLIVAAPYFGSLGLEYHSYGILFSILTFVGGIIAFTSRKLIQKPDLSIITFVGLVAIPLSFGLMGGIPSQVGLIGYFLFAIPQGLCTAVTNSLLNRQFSAHSHRATFLSIVDFFVRIVASSLALILGWVLAHKGIGTTLLCATVFSGTAAVLLSFGILKYAVSTQVGSPAARKP